MKFFKNIMKTIAKIDAKIAVIEDIILVALITGLLFLLGVQVMSRYLFSFVFPWSEEIARQMMVVMTLIGVGFASRTERHLDVSLVNDFLEKRQSLKGVAFFLKRFVLLVTFAFSFYITVLITHVTILQYEMGQVLATLPWFKIWPIYVSGVVGMGLMSIRFFIKFLVTFADCKGEMEC